MKLSDSFMPGRNGQGHCLECEAVILNINQEHNRELLEKCRRLGEYTEFVAKVRQYLRQEVSVEMAIRQTVEECLREGILVDVLTRCKTEVLEVLLTEYNEEETREYLRREAIEEGLEQGLEEGLAKGLEQGLKLLIETCQELGVSKKDTEVRVLDKCKLNEEELHRYMETYWKTNKGE